MRWTWVLFVFALASCDTLTPPEPTPPDPCPAASNPGMSAVLPVSVGQRWDYALSSFRRTSSAEYYRSSGLVEVEVVEAGRCADDTQTFVIRERRVETTERRRPDGDWESNEPETTVRTYRWTVSDSLVTTDAPDLSGRQGGGLAPPPFGREAPRFVPTADLLPDGSVRLGGHTAFGPYVTLVEEVGPVRYATTTLFGTAGQASEEWTIME